MLTLHIQNLIRQNLGHIPTPSQQEVIQALADFIAGSENQQAFVLKGFAGTGKTTLVSALAKALDELGIKTLLLAPTGRSAKVFSLYTGKPAYTIHRKIYRQKVINEGGGVFVLNKNLLHHAVIMVDESSMISNAGSEDNTFGSGNLLADLIEFVQCSATCRLIMIGDTAQLPPVGTELSPALCTEELSIYLRVAGEKMLTDIVRQDKNSGILENATKVRFNIMHNNPRMPHLTSQGFSDVGFIQGIDMIEKLENAYRKFGVNEVIVICRSNKRATQYNSGIRKQVFYFEEDLVKDDLLMVVRNNYHWETGHPEVEFIANGDIVKVVKIIRYTERYGLRFALVTLEMTDYPLEFEAWVLINTLNSDNASLKNDDYQTLFRNVMEDYAHLGSRKKQYEAVRNDPFFNALQVKHAYAITCHKAQGGQWKTVFIDAGNLPDEALSLEFLRWLYTGITRGTHELYFVNFKHCAD
jgi:exodeoxyribonuclease-5